MSIQDLGSIGEIIGAIATVAMLAYLAVQVRQNSRQLAEATKVAKLDAYDRTVEAFARYRAHLTVPENAELYVSGLLSFDNLSEPEKVRFRTILEEYFFAYRGTWERSLNDAYDNAVWTAQAKGAAKLLLTTGGSQWWAARKHLLDEKFVSEMERLRDAT